MRRAAALLFGALLCMGLTSGGTRPPEPPKLNILQFDTPPVDDRRLPTHLKSLSAETIDRLTRRWSVELPERSDGSPLFVANVAMASGEHDVVIVGTTAGRVVALNAANGGETLWETNPPEGPQFTTSSPAVDPQARWVFQYCLDGRVHKYAIEDGHEITRDAWPIRVTRKPDVEKGSSNLTIATARDGHTYLYMTLAAYPDPGDEGDYQGHFVAIDIDSGARRVFNVLCSDRAVLFDDSRGAGDCDQMQAGVWARSAAVYDSATDRVFFTAGNGLFDADHGGANWSDSVIALRPDGSSDGGTPLDSYTPRDFQYLSDNDLDLGSTTVVILPLPRRLGLPRLGVQSGKDGALRLLNLEDLSGARAPRNLGGELQVISVPQGGPVRTQPEAWFDAASRTTRLFVANNHGVSGLRVDVDEDGQPLLLPVWMRRDVTGTSPVVANGMLFVAATHALRALDPATGAVLWEDSTIGDIHWQSAIVVNRQVYLADNNGRFYSWSVQ